jgi:hypothetical protein
MSTTVSQPNTRRFETRHHCWHLHAAVSGSASAVPVPREAGIDVLLTEGDHLHSSTTGTNGPWTRLCLGSHGTVTAQTHAAPPALLLNTAGDAVPLAPGNGTQTANIAPGGLVLACSPSILQALDPSELRAIPRLLHAAPDLSTLLARWILAAGRTDATGAGAIIARYQSDQRPVIELLPAGGLASPASPTPGLNLRVRPPRLATASTGGSSTTVS